jgi:hypothetical protein
MALTAVQQGVIAQMEFAKLLMMGSNGKLEVSSPLSDDERRDAEVHLHGAFGQGLAFQVKSSMRLHSRPRLVVRLLYIHFEVARKRLVSDPRFWYFFAYLDRKTMAFQDPVFLVDSLTVHKHALARLRGDTWRFGFQASMGPGGRDKWVPFRVNASDVGQRVLDIMRDLKSLPAASRPSTGFELPPAALWVRPKTNR